ncbi:MULTISPECIES: VOC family protein [unclassified Roseibium]|uniref:VOC family protein n=1 Tax=unclassified Roseibium TaxID=2629323 RepID=UPI00273F10F6|nr:MULTISPECIES: VOC family protein [unclassified Roseibium]
MPEIIPTQGVHHITLIGADRQSTIGFWEGVLGMPFLFEQPNLDNPDDGHLYFDPGDGRLITIFTSESRKPTDGKAPQGLGAVHHIAFEVSAAIYEELTERLEAHGISCSLKDRGFMNSCYFKDPLGLTIELASYKFVPPAGHSASSVLHHAHLERVRSGDDAIATKHVAAALTRISENRTSLSD